MITGSYQNIDFQNIQFIDNRPLTNPPQFNQEVRISGKYTQANFNKLLFANSCLSEHSFDHDGNFILKPSNSCLKQTIPAIFIPGIGASLNLELLTTKPIPDREVDFSKWHFLETATPQYFELIRNFEKLHIPLQIAYYDWRLSIDEIARNYLVPAIMQLKAITGAPKVNIIAHSMGGLVARHYLQSELFQNDIENLIQLGTPNLGAPKAYSVWEGAKIPDDWAAFEYLIRFYQFQYASDKLNRLGTVHNFFPSIRDLLPTYPFLKVDSDPNLITLTHWPNNNLIALNQKTSSDVPIYIYYSKENPTTTYLDVTSTSSQASYWKDGKLMEEIIDLGDGTVPEISANGLEYLNNFEVTGSHLSLISSALPQILSRFYPLLSDETAPDDELLSYQYADLLLDCPLNVSLTLPDNTQVDFSTIDNTHQPGFVEIFTNPNLSWLRVPIMPGIYHLSLTALEDTVARYWINQESIHSEFLLKDENKTYEFSLVKENNTPEDNEKTTEIHNPENTISETRDSQINKDFIKKDMSNDETKPDISTLTKNPVSVVSTDLPQNVRLRYLPSISRLNFSEQDQPIRLNNTNYAIHQEIQPQKPRIILLVILFLFLVALNLTLRFSAKNPDPDPP